MYIVLSNAFGRKTSKMTSIPKENKPVSVANTKLYQHIEYLCRKRVSDLRKKSILGMLAFIYYDPAVKEKDFSNVDMIEAFSWSQTKVDIKFLRAVYDVLYTDVVNSQVENHFKI